MSEPTKAASDAPNWDAISRAKILASFVNELMPRLSHVDCVDIRGHLVAIRDEDAVRILPSVLLDLLEVRPSDPIKTDGAEDVLTYLDAGKGNPLVVAAKTRVFDSLNDAQISAVLHWLLAARTWEVFELYDFVINSALSFWHDLAEARSRTKKKKRETGT